MCLFIKERSINLDHDLIKSVAKNETAIKDRNFRICLIYNFTVKVNFSWISHGLKVLLQVFFKICGTIGYTLHRIMGKITALFNVIVLQGIFI